MADKTQLNIADKSDFANEDPFAELTRSMGFDPSQPVVRQDVGAPTGGGGPVMDDDLGIDLEREILGELAGDDLVEAHEYDASAVYSQAEERKAYAPVAYAPVEESAYAHAQNPEVTSEASFDDAVAASFEQDFLLEDELLAGEETSWHGAAQVSYTALSEADLDSDILDTDFDVAFAEVDMDFLANDDTNYTVEAVSDDELTLGDCQVAAPEIAFSHADLVEEPQVAAEPVAYPQDYGEFERRLQDPLRDEELAYESSVAYEAPAYELEVAQVVDPVAVVEDNSFEDELNARFDSMSCQPDALSKLTPLRAFEPVSAESDPTFSSSLWTPEKPAEEATQAFEDIDCAPSYDASVEEFMVAKEAALLQANDGYPEPSYNHQADIDVSVDDDAFDMALERSHVAEIAKIVVPAAVASSATALLRPLAASRYEQVRNWGLGTPVASSASIPAGEAQSSYRSEAIQKPDAYVPIAPTYAAQARPEDYAPESYAQQVEPEAYVQATEHVVEKIDDLEAELFAAVSAFDDAPDIETVDVPEKAVALADDLDIPALSFEYDAPLAPGYDDLDGEFSSLINEMNATETVKLTSSSSYASNLYAAGFDHKTLRDSDASKPEAFGTTAGAVAGAATMYASGQSMSQGNDRSGGFDLEGMQQGHGNAPLQQTKADEFDYALGFHEAMEALHGSAAAARPERHSMMIAAIFGAVVVVGGIGAFALSFGDSESAGTPVIVNADRTPIKVKPENSGGTSVPNQDNKVYDRVAGGTTKGETAQDKLITSAEEPVDFATQDADADVPEGLPLNGNDTAAEPTKKSEEPMSQTAQVDQPDASTKNATVALRKVRTMVVKPDGTLVPREKLASVAIAAAESTDPTQRSVLTPVAKSVQTANTPITAPIPLQSPVDFVGEVKPDEVSAIAPSVPTAAASGAWTMQIASQPSEDAAKSTYMDLARRYGSVLKGREISLVKVDIAGKGTFWRVRVPAGTRNDAVSLCESYKAAGGNCFVSK